MSDHTKIEWTDATANVINGCTVKSAGCTNCYAMRLAGTRMKHHPTRAGLTQDTKAGPVWTGEVRFNEAALLQVLKWKKPRMIFWNAHGDMFHEEVPDAWIDRCFAVMALTPHHTHQVLTKRADRMRAYFSGPIAKIDGKNMRRSLWRVAAGRPPIGRDLTGYVQWPLKNVWLGVSVEDQRAADERIPDLLATPAAVRWISAEPLLGPVDLDCPDVDWMQYPEGNGIVGDRLKYDWVVVGGESGPKARPMHPDWARSLRDQCAAAGVPFLFKQWGEWVPQLGAIDGWTLDDDPEQSRFKHCDWEDGKWGDPYYPSWMDERADDTVSRVGKKAAGRHLDGVQHDAYPARES